MKFFNYFFLLFPLLNTSQGFNPNFLIKTSNNIYKNYNSLGEYKSYFEPNLFSSIHHFTECKENKIEHFSNLIGNEVVKFVSSALPQVDQVGHQILHANNIYINNILNNDKIPHEIQKDLILIIIKIAQYGDDMGSHLLQMYFDLVNKSL